MDLSVQIGSLRLKNPLIADRAARFGYGVEYADLVDLSSLGGVAVKGLFLNEREGHPAPRIVETPSGMLNAIGLQGIGVRRFVDEKLPELRARNATVIVNVCGTTVDEYAEVSRILSDAEGVHALELNISCPNIKEGGIQFGCSLNGTHDVVSAIRKVTRLPIIPKLTPNVTDVASFARASEDAGADAVSLVNTFLAMVLDIETRRPKISNGMGGLSGPAIRPIAVRMVYECRQAVRIPIVGMGGIADARDALEFMIAGAAAVQVGTANFADPLIWGKLLDGITSYMERHQIDTLSRTSRRHSDHRPPTTDMNQILVALDVDTAEAAYALADKLRGAVGGFKIGKRLFTSYGPSVVETLVARGDRVFLDLKFHDIPNTVAGAVAAATRLGVWMVNVHASGGRAMMTAARDAADAEAAKLSRPKPLVIAVTMLTSLAEESLRAKSAWPAASRRLQVERLAVLAASRPVSATVSSPRRRKSESSASVAARRLEIVTPGIRSASDDKGDQSRTLTAAQALAAGASYLVVGRLHHRRRRPARRRRAHRRDAER